MNKVFNDTITRRYWSIKELCKTFNVRHQKIWDLVDKYRKTFHTKNVRRPGKIDQREKQFVESILSNP